MKWWWLVWNSKKSSLTASVATVPAKELSKQMGHSVAAALQGRAPGVEILQKGGEAGADIKILVRGAGTFGATEPLYVIDGAFSNNGLNSLNPSDIESIEILKMVRRLPFMALALQMGLC